MPHDKCGDEGCIAPMNEPECGWGCPVPTVGTKVVYSKHFRIQQCMHPGSRDWNHEGVITGYSDSGYPWVRWPGNSWDRTVNPLNLTTLDDPELIEFIAAEERTAHQQGVVTKLLDVVQHLRTLGEDTMADEASNLYTKAMHTFAG